MDADGQTVKVGSWVRVRDGDEDVTWQIVEPGAGDWTRNLVSADAPLARALLGHQAGDQVRVEGPLRRPVRILRVGVPEF